MNDQTYRKLTAYVDGVLTPRERAVVERVVAEDPLAGDVLRSLESDSALLRSLPRVTAPPDLAQEVLRLIEISGRKPSSRPSIARSPSHWWHAAAASIILALGVGSYWLLQDVTRPGAAGVGGELAKVNNQAVPAAEPPKVVAGPTEANPPLARTEDQPDRTNAPGSGPSVATETRNADGSTDRVGESSTTEVAKDASVPAFAEPEYLTSPMLGPTKKFKTMDLRLPPIVDLKTARLDELFAGLDRDNLYGLDLVCNENAKALARFQAACHAAGVRVLIDAPLQPHLGKRIAVPCMAYLENVSAAQVAKLLTALRDLDAKAEETQKGDGQFESIFVQTLDETGRKGVAEALGVTPSTLNPPAASGRIDPSKPIANDTLKSLEQQAAGQGAGKPTAPPTVVVMAYSPMWNRATLSKDLKLHLEMRRGWQPDALHVFFYFRAARP